MAYQVEFTEIALKNLQRCRRKDRDRILDDVSTSSTHRIEKLAQDPQHKNNVKKLVNFGVAYRMRVGNYRVLFEREDTLRIIDIIDVLTRQEAYKRR